MNHVENGTLQAPEEPPASQERVGHSQASRNLYTADAGMDEHGENQIDINDQWQIINSFFEQNGVVNQQIQSFNQFVEHTIADCVREHQANFVKIERQFVPGQTSTFFDHGDDDVCL